VASASIACASRRRAPEELNDFLYVFIGSATGGGVVIGGDCHRGAHSNAGDLGLMPTSPSRLATAPEPTGHREILLTRASINALIRHLRGSGAPVTTRTELDAAITAHPTLVDEWLDDCADALVDPLLAAVSVLDVEAVVLDGDLPRPVLESLVERLRRLTLAATPEARQVPPIGLGQIGRQAAAMGAAILPLHVNYGPSRDLPAGSYGVSNARAPAARAGRLSRAVALGSPSPS
jgi:predicted NBD/HSP70 family sugar kinase